MKTIIILYFSGYIGDEDANASTFDPNGWLKTGDIGYFDRNGFLYIVDRIKELIKYKGYQVYLFNSLYFILYFFYVILMKILR